MLFRKKTYGRVKKNVRKSHSAFFWLITISAVLLALLFCYELLINTAKFFGLVPTAVVIGIILFFVLKNPVNNLIDTIKTKIRRNLATVEYKEVVECGNPTDEDIKREQHLVDMIESYLKRNEYSILKLKQKYVDYGNNRFRYDKANLLGIGDPDILREDQINLANRDYNHVHDWEEFISGKLYEECKKDGKPFETRFEVKDEGLRCVQISLSELRSDTERIQKIIKEYDEILNLADKTPVINRKYYTASELHMDIVKTRNKFVGKPVAYSKPLIKSEIKKKFKRKDNEGSIVLDPRYYSLRFSDMQEVVDSL